MIKMSQYSIKSSNFELMREPLLNPLWNKYNIDFINYVRYEDDKVKMICSTIYDDELDNFMNDKYNALPLEICQENSIVAWADYCSDEFMDSIHHRYQYSPDGVAIILKHHDFAEHIELGSSDINADIFNLIRSDQQAKKDIVAFIRTHLNSTRGRYQTKTYRNTIVTLKKKSHH
jgi:hypothetical protein